MCKLKKNARFVAKIGENMQNKMYQISVLGMVTLTVYILTLTA
jgi:hypothetical protein